MTVESAVNRIDIVSAANQTVFNFGFKYFESSDIQVYLNSVLQTTGFTVTPSAQGTDNGGSVTFSTAPATGSNVAIVRVLPITQTSDYEEGDRLPSQQLEDDLDRAAMVNQQQREDLERRPALAASSLIKNVEIVEPTTAIVGHAFVWRQNPDDTFFLGASTENVDDALTTINQVLADAQTAATNSANSATASANSATASAASATAAAASATAAATSATNAAAAETTVINQGNTQVARVIAEGDTQVARVQAAGSSLVAPTSLSLNEPSYNFDGEVGTLSETVTRDSVQTYTSPSGTVMTALPDIITPSYKNERFGFEIYETRTNTVLQSEALNVTPWAVFSASVASDNTAAPDGGTGTTADKVVENTANASHGISQMVSFTSGSIYTASAYVKADTRSIIRIAGGSSAIWNADMTFNIATETLTVAQGTGSFEKLSSGWYRIVLTATATSTAQTNISFFIANAAGQFVYTGDGSSGLFIWGVQLEAGFSVSPYISTTTASVQRPSTNINISLNDVLNPDEGTFVVELDKNSENVSRIPISLGATQDGAMFLTAQDGRIDFQARNTSNVRFGPFRTLVTGYNKISAAYSSSGLRLSTNGGEVSLAAGEVDSSDWGDLYIGRASWTQQNYFNDAIYSITYYPNAFTDAELQASSALEASNTFVGAVESITRPIKASVRELRNDLLEEKLIPNYRERVRHIRQLNAGTSGGTNSVGVQVVQATAISNSVLCGSADLTNNRFTLPQGFYWVTGYVKVVGTGESSVQIVSVGTGRGSVLMGEQNDVALTNTNTLLRIEGMLEAVNETETFFIELYTETAVTNTGLGLPTNLPTTTNSNVFSEFNIIRL